MNNNTRRQLERRQERRRQRLRGSCNRSSSTAGLCAICRRRPPVLEGEIGDRTAPGGSILYPACVQCARQAPSLIRRIGYEGLRKIIRKSLAKHNEIQP